MRWDSPVGLSTRMPTMSPNKPAGGCASGTLTRLMPRLRARCSTLITLTLPSPRGGLRFIGAGAEVRRQDDVVQAEERVVLLRGLLDEDVDRGASDLLGLQRLGEGELVHDFAPGVVDHQQVGADFAEEALAVEQVF